MDFAFSRPPCFRYAPRLFIDGFVVRSTSLSQASQEAKGASSWVPRGSRQDVASVCMWHQSRRRLFLKLLSFPYRGGPRADTRSLQGHKQDPMPNSRRLHRQIRRQWLPRWRLHMRLGQRLVPGSKTCQPQRPLSSRSSVLTITIGCTGHWAPSRTRLACSTSQPHMCLLDPEYRRCSLSQRGHRMLRRITGAHHTWPDWSSWSHNLLRYRIAHSAHRTLTPYEDLAQRS
ncbi:hypothetical protein T440DRAFT_291325 [Plenodomus tracheiphilus IPT5]|uniref:Uncharacterized protein n=1 Tax=Plenodomus tracheiphilus IPT5 TaxID=1408161 RepID=A0A6A7BF10_9PLEO|nr:hypothetical protein T440DRAFT_291325 [Plenodomus tracheiphilus IPT5]